MRSELSRLAVALGDRARARILIEASTESEWVARGLEGLGHEVIVADPNFARLYATRQRKVKTDRRDVPALAEACVLGAYRRRMSTVAQGEPLRVAHMEPVWRRDRTPCIQVVSTPPGFRARDVLSFLGRNWHEKFEGEVVTDQFDHALHGRLPGRRSSIA